MTFDEYNTDETFKGDSTADELVRLAKEEKKERADVENSLSPLWKEDKKGNVKKALDKYYPSETPKEEPKKEEAPKVEEMTQTTEALEQPKAEQKEEKTPYTSPLESEETGIRQSDKNYLNETNAILNEEQKKELQKLAKTSADDYNRTMENMERSGDAFKKIDDKLIEQLPTFMFKRYQQGEFGDPKSGDAKLRLAYFAMNNVVSKLKQFANASAAARGQGTLFQNTESAYDQYQKSNLEQGLENRWSKYKQETQAAIDMVKNRNISEEEALNIINKISMNNRLQNAYNMADENKKAYMIEVLSKVGDKVTNWNDQKFINALIGAEITGENVDNAVALIGSRAGMKIGEQLNIIDENGNLDISALKSMINIPGFTDKFKAQFGFDPNNLIPKEGEDKGTGTTLEDGTKVDPGKNMSKDELAQLRTEAEKLGNKFYNGEMTEEEFRKEYAKLEGVMKQHGIRNAISGGIMSQDDYLNQIRRNKRVDLSSQIDALNAKAKNGDIKPSEYDEKFKALKTQAAEWGASEKDLQSIEKGKVKNDKILKASEKKSKKK